MSISQQRMIEILDDYQQLDKLYSALRRAILAQYTDPSIAPLIMIAPDFISRAVVRETEHFRLVARRNERTATKARAKRLAQGMEPRQQFETIGAKLAASNLQPQFTPEAFNPKLLTYTEAKTSGDYTAQELYDMYPDEAPVPLSSKIDESMYRVDE